MRTATRLLVSLAAALVVAAPAGTAVAHPTDPIGHYRVVAHATAAHAATGPVTHRVVHGDTLSAIATGWQRTVAQVAGYNHLADANLIVVGQRLVRPPAGYVAPYVAPPPARRWASTPPGPPVAAQVAPVAVAGDVWGCIAGLESTGVRYRINPAVDTGNGYYGAFQFLLSTWQSIGGPPGLPSSYPYATQLAMAQKLQAIAGWGQWPQTSAACGV